MNWQLVRSNQDRLAAFRLRSLGYKRYYRNIPDRLYTDRFDDLLLPDGRGYSQTVLVTQSGEAVGTGRVTLVSSPQYPMLESELHFLFGAPFSSLVKTKSDCIGELGRFTVLNTQSTDDVMRHIFAGFVYVAEMYGIKQYYAATNIFVARRVKQVGLNLKPVRNIEIDIENPDVLWYCVKYFDYFYPQLREVLPDVLDPEFSETRPISYDHLRQTVDALYPHKPVSLYQVTPESIIQNVLLGNYYAQVETSA